MTKLSIILALVGAIGVANAECPNACSGHGECGVFDQCSCYRNWQSNDCSQRTCPFGHAHVDTPKGDLNMNGGALSGPKDPVIINSEVYPLGTTEQYPDAQDNEAHFYMECSNKGLCDRKSGLCKCFDGYDGSSCQRASCPGGVAGDSDQCSGRGTCHSIDYLAHYHGESHFPLDYSSTVSYKLWDAGYTRGCLCDPRFTGADCASRKCKFGVDPLYVSTGTALYQKAFVVNSCQASELVDALAVPGNSITTNGNHHVYENVTYTEATAGVLDNLAAYDGTITINADAVPAWAVAGAEIIATEDAAAPSNFGDDNYISTIGCRYTVVGAEVAVSGTDVTMYVKATGETSNSNLVKCSANGKMADGVEYTVYHVVNTFTLLFTDHFGAVYRTVPISAAVADYSDEIKAALEGLPNRVVGEVVVRGVMVNPFDDVDVTAGTDPKSPAEMAYEIEFISNPGQLNALKIDSTPIRLGQTLQAGIECEFNQTTLEHESIVYSSVGYSEIGEDFTNFAEYIGNVGFFTNQEYKVDSTDSDVIVSGRENRFIYTATDLTSVLASEDVIKIKNEIYVVDDITASYIKLNTWFNGDAVQGISKQLYENNEFGANDGDVFTLKVDGGKLVVFEAKFSTPSFNSDGENRFDHRAGDFAEGQYIRITSETIASNHTFDCIFLLEAVTNATYLSTAADVAATTYLNNTWTYTLTADMGSCPTLVASTTENTDGIGVKLYQWEPTGYTNGRYAEKTRIFKKSGDAATPVLNNGNKVPLAIQRGSKKALKQVTSCVDAGTKVLYGNEINVVDSCEDGHIIFKNAVAWETSYFAVDEEAVSSASLEGYDFENLYTLPDDFGNSNARDYRYVSQCSNRGVCDGVSGVCKCFKGYTGDSCNTISELFG